MKMRFTLAVALLCPLFLIAQPTITSDWIGQAGENIKTVSTLEVPDAGEAGADKVWDFTNVTPDTTELALSYVNPDTTPFIDLYPNTNSCLSVPEFGIYTYFILDNSKWEFHGTAFETAQKIYQDPQTRLLFPMNFEDSFTDEFASTQSFFGVTIFGTGNVEVIADAYGTLTLPNGTFDDVMRLKITEETIDSTHLGGNLVEKVHVTTVSFVWLSRAHPGPLCTRSYTEGFQVGLCPPIPPDTVFWEPDSTFQFDPTATNSAVPYFSTDAFELEITPNPFVGKLNLNFTVDNRQKLQFELYTINGQVVYSEKLTASPGYNTYDINVQGLPVGSYIAVLKGKKEGSIKRLVKIE